MDPYFGKLFQGRPDADAYREAFAETLKCIEGVDDFDVLGHLDYVVRYGKHQAQEYSYSCLLYTSALMAYAVKYGA